jgi:putative SOS response-associated peptidase YedK
MLVPPNAADPSHYRATFNARAETVDAKPAYRHAFRYQRCLVPATGFREWEKNGVSPKRSFQFELGQGELFALAGIWERWNRGDEIIESCSIITVDANELVQSPTRELAEFHHRMPVILRSEHFPLWLDSDERSIPHLKELLQPYGASSMRAREIPRAAPRPKPQLDLF